MKLLSKNLQGFDDVQVGKREDIPIEKGAVLGEDFLRRIKIWWRSIVIFLLLIQTYFWI